MLERFRRRRDPTVAWTADPALAATLDLDRHRICGAGLGEPVERLAGLGPAEDGPAAARGELRYPSRGLSVSTVDGLVTAFFVAWREPGYAPFAGRVTSDGREVGLAGGSTPEDLVAMLGTPYWRAEDPDEVILFYERRDVEWQLECDHGTGLRAMVIVSPPILADPAQREAYGVTAAWPPPL